ncbi:MAG: glycosyltransferase family 39 protein [Lentisphaeraceae bacterium]|nr:glycosyltransferase family 39 protein [Lentisphaeraceae bacterium]
MYTENELNKSWKWILGLVSALLLLPQLAMRELTNTEALYGTVARNAVESGNYLNTLAYGRQLDEGLLYPWIINFFGTLGINEFTIRLPSILGLAIMIYCAAYITYKYAGRQSAIVAGTCMLSSIAAVKMGSRGEENILGAAMISTAWLCWYQYSRNQKKWFKAWFYSLLLVSLAVYFMGLHSVFLFYLPLFFLKKPTNVRKRLFHPPHFKALAAVLALHFLVYLAYTNLSDKNAQTIGLTFPTGATDHYLWDLFSFPFEALLWLMPWTFFSWPAFCGSFTAMEKEPQLFHFLRTISITLFICFWFIPDSDSMTLLPVLLPVSIMTGLHYQILVRRYHTHIRKLIRFTLALLILVNFAWLIFFGLNYSGMLNITISQTWTIINIVISLLAILLSIFLLIKGREYPVWLKIMCTVVIGHWCIITYKSIPFDRKSTLTEVATDLTKNIPVGTDVYNFTTKKHFAVMFYTKRPVIQVESEMDNSKNKLPATIYVIAGDKKPFKITKDPAFYKWEALSELLRSKDGDEFKAWKGIQRTP